MKRIFFKKIDIIVVLVVFLLGAAIWWWNQKIDSGKAAKAEIYYYSQLVQTVRLDTGVDEHFSIPQNEHVIFHLSADGSLCFEQSNCPDKVCIHAGKLNTVGQSAACLPNGIVIKIVPKQSRNEDDHDIVVGG